MPKYYSKTLKLISIITLAAFIATQCGLGYAHDSLSKSTTSKLRQMQMRDTTASTTALAAGKAVGETSGAAIGKDTILHSIISLVSAVALSSLFVLRVAERAGAHFSGIFAFLNRPHDYDGTWATWFNMSYANDLLVPFGVISFTYLSMVLVSVFIRAKIARNIARCVYLFVIIATGVIGIFPLAYSELPATDGWIFLSYPLTSFFMAKFLSLKPIYGPYMPNKNLKTNSPSRGAVAEASGAAQADLSPEAKPEPYTEAAKGDAKGGGLDPKTQSDILNSAEETYEEIGNKFGIDSGLIYWQPLCKRVSEILAHKLSALGYEVEVVISYWSLERDGHYFIILQRNDEYWVIDAVWQQVVDEARLNPLKKVLIIKVFDKGAVFDADRFIDALTKFGLPSEDKEYIIFDVWLYALRRKNAEQRQTQADAKGDAKGADDNARLKFDLVQNIDMGLWKSQIEDVSQKFPPTYFKNYILYTMSSDNGITIIAHRGNELLGYITGGRLEECDLYDRNFGSDSSVFITGILVKKGLRGGGLGRTLLARFIRESRKRGYKFLSTYTISARLVHLLRDMPATPCLEEYDIGGYTFVTLALSGSALPPLDKRWIFIKSLGKIARLTVLHKIRKGGSIEDAKAELRRLAIPARQSLAEAEAKGQAQAVGAEIEQSITEFLDDLNKLKEQFRITMTPDPKIEAALPQGDPDFEWVFATLLRGNAYWYDYFPDMYGIVLSRGVSDDMLNSGSSNNIFDKFAVNYGEISRRFIRSLEELGYSKQSNFKYSYFVTDNRNLQPAEITRKFVKEFGVPNQDIVTVRYERDPRLKDKVAVVITQRRDDGIISIKEDLLRKGFAIWNIINVQVYPDDYKCLQDGDLRAINRILEEARKMAGEREIFVVINVLKIDNEALANNLTKICDLVLSQNELEDQKLRDKIEAQAVGAAA